MVKNQGVGITLKSAYEPNIRQVFSVFLEIGYDGYHKRANFNQFKKCKLTVVEKCL
jgi:hypothetical protein